MLTSLPSAVAFAAKTDATTSDKKSDKKSDAKSDVEDDNDNDNGNQATSEPAPADAPPPTPVIDATPAPKTVPPAPLLSGEPGWQMGFFGFLELDAIWDSTQSFSETVLDNTIARPHTVAGDNARFQGTAKDSRLGYKIAAPPFGGSLKASAFMEADFFGIIPTTATQDQSYVYDTIRLRQYYAKLETPIVDLLVGQTFDLYGFGGQGFFPNTPAFLGVMGELFHRNVQLRLTKVIETDPVNVEISVAGVRPATRDSGVPDAQAGLKINVNGWQGASAQGPRLVKTAPLSLGVSAVGRKLSVTDFEAIVASPQTVYGWGAAADLFLPIIPARGKDLSNAFSVTGEYSRGTGVTDLYLTLTGGVLFPSLPNPKNVLPAPTYTPNIDPGIVTFDANGSAKSIEWQGMMVNGHYHLPMREGRMLSISGTYSRIQSNNALTLTPMQGQAFVWNKGHYWDATIWWSITPAFQMAASYQSMTQTFGDGTVARNNRVQGGWWFFF
ncbi:MAG TPA: hypothetical protein VH560_17285 [Polyangia bacterium]|nr:hypothetical protein [Polyangia bacterium]